VLPLFIEASVINSIVISFGQKLDVAILPGRSKESSSSNALWHLEALINQTSCDTGVAIATPSTHSLIAKEGALSCAVYTKSKTNQKSNAKDLKYYGSIKNNIVEKFFF
jgi:hypothetical protein